MCKLFHTYTSTGGANDVSSHLKGPISRANKLVKKFNKLTEATEMLIKSVKKAHHCLPNLMELNISGDFLAT